ncbi:MAG TPA: M1 family aminopeptidase [Myxococcales bacterium]
MLWGPIAAALLSAAVPAPAAKPADAKPAAAAAKPAKPAASAANAKAGEKKDQAAPSPAKEKDPELEMLAQSLIPSQRAAVEKETGGLAGLPRYRLDLELDPQAKVLKGREQIVLALKEEFNELWLRLPANAGLEEGSRPVSIVRVVAGGKEVTLEARDPGMYRLPLEPPLAAGPALVEVEFRAEVPELKGVGSDSTSGMLDQAMALLSGRGGEERGARHGTFGWSATSFNLAGFAPELARREAGVFDASPEPGIGEPRWGPLGNWVVSLVTPTTMAVAGTGVELGSTPEKDGRKRSTRVAAAVRGFALVAADGWNEQKQAVGEVQVRALAAPGHDLQARKLMDTAARALKFFTEKLGPYPWAQLDVVEAPLTGSIEAVSFPTLLLVSGLLTSPAKLDPRFAQAGDPTKIVDDVLELVAAHHVAHQWWGGVVGSDGAGRPALHEPVTSYGAYLYVEQRRGGEQSRRLIEEQMMRSYRLRRTLGHPDLSVDRPLIEVGGRLELEGILRGKGGLYYQKLRKLIGDKAFFAALRESVARNRFKDIDSDAVLIGAAGAAPNQAQAALALHDRWMRQLHGDEDIGASLDFENLGGGMKVDPATAKMLQQMIRAIGGNTSGPPPAVPAVNPKAPPPGQGGQQPGP